MEVANALDYVPVAWRPKVDLCATSDRPVEVSPDEWQLPLVLSREECDEIWQQWFERFKGPANHA